MSTMSPGQHSQAFNVVAVARVEVPGQVSVEESLEAVRRFRPQSRAPQGVSFAS